MSDGETRILWSRDGDGDISFLDWRRSARSVAAPETQPQPAGDPTSWNGISYDDLMRTLEEGLPESERPTLVALRDTQPAPFAPMNVTQRMTVQAVTSIAPVAMPAMPPPHAVDTRIAFARPPRPRHGKAVFIGAALGALIAVVALASTDPATRGSAATAATDARAHFSGWVSRVRGESSKPAIAAAAAPPPAVIAEPVATADAPPSIPQMRAPTPPPPRRVVTKTKPIAPANDEPNEGVVDPTSLLNNGIGD